MWQVRALVRFRALFGSHIYLRASHISAYVVLNRREHSITHAIAANLWISEVVNALTMASDITIAAFMIFLLANAKNGIRQSDTLINRLMVRIMFDVSRCPRSDTLDSSLLWTLDWSQVSALSSPSSLQSGSPPTIYTAYFTSSPASCETFTPSLVTLLNLYGIDISIPCLPLSMLAEREATRVQW